MISKSEQETAQIARNLAKQINAPATITLCGDLGAGKSSFARAFLKAKGVTGPISSPTLPLLIFIHQITDHNLHTWIFID